MPAWSGQGPFDNGFESSQAMERALIAAFGNAEGKIWEDAVLGHEASFNLHPDKWEENRILALEEGSLAAIELGKNILLTEATKRKEVLFNPEETKGFLEKIEALDDWIAYRKNNLHEQFS